MMKKDTSAIEAHVTTLANISVNLMLHLVTLECPLCFKYLGTQLARIHLSNALVVFVHVIAIGDPLGKILSTITTPKLEKLPSMFLHVDSQIFFSCEFFEAFRTLYHTWVFFFAFHLRNQTKIFSFNIYLTDSQVNIETKINNHELEPYSNTKIIIQHKEKTL